MKEVRGWKWEASCAAAEAHERAWHLLSRGTQSKTVPGLPFAVQVSEIFLSGYSLYAVSNCCSHIPAPSCALSSSNISTRSAGLSFLS